MDFDKHVKEIEEKIGYTFKDTSLLKQAFTRTSFCNENRSSANIGYQSNEVLEFFGDSVLSAAIVTLLMRDFAKKYEHGISTELNEGDFSNIKSKLSDKKNLSLATKSMGLEKYLQMGEGDSKLGIQNEPSVMEDLFESIIGAIYIDCGNDMKPVIASVSKMLDVQEYASAKKTAIQSYKNSLQEWCADKRHKRPAPVYKTVSESGPDHKKVYERACYIGDKVYGIGQGKNLKLADSAAAEEALKALTVEVEKLKIQTLTEKTALSVQRLKEYAAKEKKPTPEFRDLGETANSTPASREYEIECRFLEMVARARSYGKREAKALAAEKILEEIERQSEKENVKRPKPVRTKQASTKRKALPSRQKAKASSRYRRKEKNR